MSNPYRPAVSRPAVLRRLVVVGALMGFACAGIAQAQRPAGASGRETTRDDRYLKVVKVTVLPLRYQAPPSSNPAAIEAYDATLPAVTQANAQAIMKDIAAWWLRETYGRQVLDVTVEPEQSLPGNPVCNWPPELMASKADINIAIMPYSCWQWHGVTSGRYIMFDGAAIPAQIEVGQIAHEMGHAMGMLHSGSRIPPALQVTEYGNSVDIMGRGNSYTGLTHFLARHKAMLGALTPRPCASATLRSIYDYPDALLCDSYYVEYLPDVQEIWITSTESAASNRGGWDNVLVARLGTGQSATVGGRTYTHAGAGKLTIR